ncbi:MAG TPA: hypothetical protein VET48_11240 [Steroidobacteraceae bacterium]|nr:hypothetical protein [Steroidobacteraceae bacterium]
MDWIKQHPYLTGTGLIVLVILYFVLRGRGTTATSTGPSEALQAAGLSAELQQGQIVAAQNAQTNQLNAALQGKLIDQQTAEFLASQSTASQNAQIDAALKAIGIETGAGVSIAQLQTSADVAKTTAATGAATDIAGIQADVLKMQTQNALDAQKANDAASIAINSQNTKAAVTTAGYAATTQQRQDALAATAFADQLATALTASKDANATAVTINNQNAGRDVNLATISAGSAALNSNNNLTESLANTNALQSIYNTFLTTNGETQTAQAQDQLQAELAQIGVQQSISNLVASGQINKGGEGGKNQVAVIAALTGQPAIGAQAEAPQPGFWQSFFGAVGNIGKGITAGVGIAGGV